MIPLGYMYKDAAKQLDGLNVTFEKACSLSHCIRPDFCDFYKFNRHNGHYFFDDPQTMHQMASEMNIPLQGLDLFYYEAFEKQWDEEGLVWKSFVAPQANVLSPTNPTLRGFDIVSYCYEEDAGCSPLLCNGLAKDFKLNQFCLFETFKQAYSALDQNRFVQCEPGPFRILSVYQVT